jgi:hypothetical protein
VRRRRGPRAARPAPGDLRLQPRLLVRQGRARHRRQAHPPSIKEAPVIAGEKVESYIAPGSDQPMRRHDANGQVCHWILEVHLVDRERQIGGFFEELLDLGLDPA